MRFIIFVVVRRGRARGLEEWEKRVEVMVW